MTLFHENRGGGGGGSNLCKKNKCLEGLTPLCKPCSCARNPGHTCLGIRSHHTPGMMQRGSPPSQAANHTRAIRMEGERRPLSPDAWEPCRSPPAPPPTHHRNVGGAQRPVETVRNRLLSQVFCFLVVFCCVVVLSTATEQRGTQPRRDVIFF